jgi:hypothetical protein
MKTMSRIATAAAALALLAAPAAFASEGGSRGEPCRDRAPTSCPCSVQHPQGTNQDKEDPNDRQQATPDFPVFTDQG